MKKTFNFQLSIFNCLLLLLLAWSCEKKETNTGSDTITLLAPADGAAFDLATVQEVVIEWSDVPHIIAYRMLIGTSGDLSDAKNIPLAASPQLFPAKKLNAILYDFGVGEGQEATFYWSVIPAIADAAVTTQVRTIALKRAIFPVIELTAPADPLDGRQTATFPATFAWTKDAPGVENYVVKFSVKETFPEDSTWTKTFKPANDDVWWELTIGTQKEFDDMMATAGVPINGQASVYWTVEPETPSPEITTLVRSFTAYRPVYPAVLLTAPADNANLNANITTFPLTFSWQQDTKIPNYTLKFSTSLSFTPSTTQSFPKNSNLSHAFSASEYDQLLSNLNIALYEQRTLYWTVVPTVTPDADTLWTFTRTFNAARKTVLQRPAGGESVVLNYKALSSDKVRFEWDATGTAELVVATDAAGSNVIFNKTGISGASAEYAHAEFQALIDDASKNLKRFKANNLFWNVKVNGSYISNQWCPFKLYGKRLFTDVRTNVAPEDYEVAVLQYKDKNGIDKEVVWLAEDVRATVPNNSGTELTQGLNQQIQPPMPVATGQGVPIPEKYRTPRTTVPRTGRYYNTDWPMVPLGWRLPSLAEWEELFTAAKAAYGGAFGDNVVRHPDFYTGNKPEHLNEWGMNLIPLGRWKYSFPPSGIPLVDFHWDSQTIYHQYDVNGYSANWDGFSLINEYMVNGTLYRAIYTEDGE
jgi:hypothetical protein